MGGVAGVLFRVITVLLAAIISWLGIASQAEALPLLSPTVTCAAFTYDDVTQSASTTDGATERGPPANYDYISVNDPVDRWLGGTTARSDGLAPRSTTTCTTPADLVQVARATGTTRPSAEGGVGTFPSLAPCRVAAEAGEDAVSIFRVHGPEETADIIGSGVYRNPAGLEGKYFYPTRAQAENLGGMYSKAGIGGPYSVSSGTVPRAVLNQAERVAPAGEGPAFFFRNDLLPNITNVTVHGPL